MTGQKIYDTTSGFRACNKALIRLFARDYPVDYPEPETNTVALLAGYRVQEVSVLMNERTTGESSISSAKSAWYMLKVTLAIIISYIKHY